MIFFNLIMSVIWEIWHLSHTQFPASSDGKVSAYNAGDPGLIPGSGSSPGEGNGTPLQYSCLENPMDGRAWQGRKESDTTEQLKWTELNWTGLCVPGFSVHGVLQARTLEWVAILFSRGTSRPRDQTWVSHIVDRLLTIWATKPLIFNLNLNLDSHLWLWPQCSSNLRYLKA